MTLSLTELVLHCQYIKEVTRRARTTNTTLEVTALQQGMNLQVVDERTDFAIVQIKDYDDYEGVPEYLIHCYGSSIGYSPSEEF